MSKGKIVKRVGEKVWANPKTSKNVYFTSIELDNGDKGEVWCNASGEMKEGEEIEYDVEKREGKPDSIRIKKSGTFGGGSFQKKPWVGEDQEAKIAGIAFSYSVQLCVGGKIESKQVVDMAESIALKMQALAAKLKATAPKPVEDAKS